MSITSHDTEGFERWERLDGVIYDMSPSPSSDHQSIVINLASEIRDYLKGKMCRVFTSPYDVYLDGNESGDYVQPDITVICDPNKIQQKGCVGVPDMIVEVLSPRTAKKDRTIKLRSYRIHGVRECWLIEPYSQTVEVFKLQDNVFVEPMVYNREDTITVGIFEGLNINLQYVFENIEDRS